MTYECGRCNERSSDLLSWKGHWLREHGLNVEESAVSWYLIFKAVLVILGILLTAGEIFRQGAAK